MLTYFDTSSLVPLVIAEAATPRCMRAWDRATTIVSTSLAYVETHAALAQARRQGRLDEAEWRTALQTFATRWDDVIYLSPSDEILDLAAEFTAAQALRGYDAVHCATALAVASDDFVAVSGDRELLRAWHDLGLPYVDTSV